MDKYKELIDEEIRKIKLEENYKDELNNIIKNYQERIQEYKNQMNSITDKILYTKEIIALVKNYDNNVSDLRKSYLKILLKNGCSILLGGFLIILLMILDFPLILPLIGIYVVVAGIILAYISASRSGYKSKLRKLNNFYNSINLEEEENRQVTLSNSFNELKQNVQKLNELVETVNEVLISLDDNINLSKDNIDYLVRERNKVIEMILNKNEAQSFIDKQFKENEVSVRVRDKEEYNGKII